MNKSTVVAIVILVLIIAGGIVEAKFFERQYGELAEQLYFCGEKCLNGTITEEESCKIEQQWEKLREQSEIFYANIDLYELNIRITDACAFIRCEDYEQAYNQFKIAEMLCGYIPQLIKPNIQHII